MVYLWSYFFLSFSYLHTSRSVMTPESERLERMKSAWDRMSVHYSEHTELAPSNPHYEALSNVFAPSIGPLRFLDLGTGTGYALDGIIPQFPQATFTCLDISEQMLARLRKRLSWCREQIVTECASYVHDPLGIEQYDFILSSFTLHHLYPTTKRAVYEKILNALKPGGSYVQLDAVASEAQALHMEQEFERSVAHRAGAHEGDWNFDLLQTMDTELELFHSAGFRSIEIPWTDRDEFGAGRAIFRAYT